MSVIKFTILGECVSMKNQRQLVHFGGKPALIKSQKAREYEKTASLQIPPEARQMLTGPVRVTMRLWYSSNRPDLDEALVLDCLQARFKRTKGKLVKIGNGEYVHAEGERVMVAKGVIVNDRQIHEKHIFWGLDKANPRCEVEVEPMQAQQEEIPLEIANEEGVPF